jgi:hypothetical protein
MVLAGLQIVHADRARPDRLAATEDLSRAQGAGGRRFGETGDKKHMRPRQRTIDDGLACLTYERVRDA